MRADAGTVRVGWRDIQALRWLDEMRAVTESDLAVLLGGLLPGVWSDEDGRPGRLSRSATQAVVRRWSRLGVADVRGRTRTDRIVVPTRAGQNLAGGRATDPVPWSVMAHTLAVARVRVIAEAEGGRHDVGWIGERSVRRQWAGPDGSPGRWVPDALVTGPDGPVAVEVEISAKAQSDLEDALVARMTDARLTRVDYWCPTEAIATRVAAMAARVRAARPTAARLHQVTTRVEVSLRDVAI